MKLPSAYQPDRYEAKLYHKWEKAGVFAAQPDVDKPRFSISMPPPNETGSLHAGHAIGFTLEDIMCRHARQKGYDVLWLPGTDHAALAVNALMEKSLAEQGTNKHKLGREKFLELTKAFVGDSRESMNAQIRALGASCDWGRARYTLDDALSRCVNEVFVSMYNDGLIYRGQRIVNWDPNLETTVSDDEVVHKSEKSPLYTLKFGPFEIATARPETKFGDKYVVMNPADKRYSQFKSGDVIEADWINGKTKATIIKDEAVDPDFGTGVMTITPWHDHTDFEIAERHGLEKEQIISFDGRLLPIAHEFAGMTIEEARPKVIEKLKSKGLVVDVNNNYEHTIALNDRGKGVIEPQIRLQWFVDVNRPAVKWKGQIRSLKEVMRAVIDDGDIEIVPKRFEKLYFHWIDNLRDWCISRQIWWGHQVPVWYKAPSQPIMGYDQTVMNQIFQGKTKTYRQKDYGYKIGDKVLVENTQTRIIFGEITIKGIIKTTVGKVNLGDTAHFVTYKNRAELIAALKKYHPEREIDKNYPIWVYEYDFEPKEIQPEVYVGAAPLEGQGWEQDPDTLDTWFSSALWTWSTLVNPAAAKDFSLSLTDILNKSPDFKTYHPTSVMETGWDILFFWVARMILATTYATGQVPFKTVYLHGLVRTPSGQKMSKSDPKGSIDPIKIINEFGADALRIALVSGTGAGNDQRLGREQITSGRNFNNKLWNIARFAQTIAKPAPLCQPETIADHWILDKLSITQQAVSKELEAYRFSDAFDTIYHFVWNDLADWYVEVSKFQPNPALLAKVLANTLIIVHPFAPFVSEAIWQCLGWEDTLLAAKDWPTLVEADKSAANDFEQVREVVSQARHISSVLGVKKPKLVYARSRLLDQQSGLIERLARLSGVAKDDSPAGLRLTNLDFDVRLAVDTKLAKDYSVKLAEQSKTLEAIVASLKKRLASPDYLKKAPQELVDQTRQQLAENQDHQAKISAEIEAFSRF